MQDNRQHITFSSTEIQRLTGPLVYIVRESGVPVYIGSSKIGLSRTFYPEHEIYFLYKRDTVELELIICHSHEEAVNLERLLIFEHGPIHNTVHNPKGRPAEYSKKKVRSLKKKDTAFKNQAKADERKEYLHQRNTIIKAMREAKRVLGPEKYAELLNKNRTAEDSC